MSLRAVVLGSGAGGGLPQWNCGCPNCRAVRRGEEGVVARTQSSVAVTADGERWLLVNASPDLRQQVVGHEALGPGDDVRGTGVEAVLVTDAEIDHSLGLLLMRESDRLTVHTTPAVRDALTDGHPVLPTLEGFLEVDWRRVDVDAPGGEARLDGPGFEATVFPVAGEPPAYAPGGPSPGDVVGVELVDPDSGARLLYAPSFGAVDDDLRRRVARSDVALLEGTFWTDDEMSAVGSGRTAADMSHVPLSGPDGTLEALGDLRDVRKVLVHVNNTNPILRRGSPERRAVEEAGFEVGRDGMTFEIPEPRETHERVHDSDEVPARGA